MIDEDERALLRSLAWEPVHDQVLRLGFPEWTAIVFLPIVCETVGEECPGWALNLCRHAAAVCQAAPVALLRVLLHADVDRAGAPCDLEVAALGVELDLFTTPLHRDPRVSITPFGHAVALLHRLHRDVEAAAVERYTA